MASPGIVARRFLFLRLLSISLALGAFYDLAFAALMIVIPELPARLLALPLPVENFYLWLLALLLAMLGTLYAMAARDPRRYSAVILVAIAGRFAGALIFVLAAHGRPDLSGLYTLAAADLVFAIAHAVLWIPLRR